MGVIDKNTGELRSTYDILQDLSKAWEGLTSVEKQELAETVAGKTQRSLFTAIMTNFDSAVGATEAALNSEGSAAAENAKRMESLQGKTQQLQSAWQDFARNTINSEAVKSLISLGTQIIKLANTDIGRLIIMLVSAKVAMVAFNKVMATNAVISLGAALKSQLLTYITAVTISFKAATVSGNMFSGALAALGTTIKTIGTALLSNPLFLAIVAFGTLATVMSVVNRKAEEARESSKALSEEHIQEANNAQTLLDTYENLSKVSNKTKEEDEKLSKTIKELSGKYGVSEEALKSEGKERDEAIKKIQDEITNRKKLAATAAEASINWKKTNFLGTQTEREAIVSRNAIEIQDKLSKKYDLTGVTVADLQKKLQNYISTLQNKNDKTKDEEKELNSLLSMYNKVSDSITTYKEGYSQALQNYKDGIPLTTEQGNALYQLGEITLEEASAIQAYNNWLTENSNATDEQKEKMWELTEAYANNEESATNLTEKQKELNEQLEEAQNKVNTTSKSLDDMQKSYNNLATAVDEYNSNGYLSIDTLQSLLSMSDEYLSTLSMENGKLVLNTTALDQKTDALVAAKVQEMQAAASSDIYALAQGNVNKMSTLAQTAIKNVGKDAVNTGANFASAVPDINKFTTAILQAKAAAGEKTTVENFDQKANAIISSYQNLYKNVTSLGRSTTRSGGLSRGGGHRYIGKSTGKKSGSGSSKKAGSGSKKSTKSTKEEYKATIDTLYKYKNALDNAKDSVDKLQDTLKNTDNYNEQEKYIKQLIAALDEEIKKTQDLKNAQSNQINDYINQLRKQGFAIDYNSSKNELYIKNMEHLGSLSGDNAKKAEKLLDKIQDLNDNNRSLDSSIRDLKKDTKDYYKQLADIPEAKLKKFNELMKDFQQNRLDQIQNQIDDIEHEMKNDPRLQQLEKQIEALEKQNDEVDKQKDLEEKLLAIEEAKEKLANAKNQKTLQVYRKGQGFVWEADPTAIKEAQEELDSAQNDLEEQQKQDQIDDLKAEKEAIEKGYQDKIDALQNFLDEQNYQIDKAGREGIQTLDQLRQELAKYGLDNAEYLGKATEWLNKYNSALKETKGTLDTISSNSATDGTLYSSSSQNRLELAKSTLRFKSILSEISSASRKVAYDKLSGGNNQSVYISNVELPNVKNANEFVEALKNLPRLAASQATIRT